MRIIAALSLIVALSVPAHGQDRRGALYGRWGDARQCAGDFLTAEGTVRAEPFVIADGWLRHGQTWCRLRWFDVQIRPGGLFTAAPALCGEDSTRSYRLDFALSHGMLTLVWDEALVNGGLGRCLEH